MSQNREEAELLPRKDRYNRSNPPSEINEAQERLDELDGTIAHIETQLDRLDIEDFQTDKDYDDWKTRAIAALSYEKAEQGFLEKWLSKREKPFVALSPKLALQSEKLAQAEKTYAEITERISVLAQSIRAEYQPRYTLRSLPETKDVALARLTVLSVLKMQLQGHFAQINSEWPRHPSCGHVRLSGVKAPLLSILSDVEAEMLAVKSVIQP